MDRYVYLCPICEREMIKTGFCHLECPAGHYQEVCSDLFEPERVKSESTTRNTPRHDENLSNEGRHPKPL